MDSEKNQKESRDGLCLGRGSNWLLPNIKYVCCSFYRVVSAAADVHCQRRQLLLRYVSPTDYHKLTPLPAYLLWNWILNSYTLSATLRNGGKSFIKSSGCSFSSVSHDNSSCCVFLALSQNCEKLHHVCLSVRMEQLCSHWTDFYEI